MKWELEDVTLYGNADDLPDTGALLVQDFDPGEYTLREQAVASPVADDVLYGREYVTPPTWTFEVVALTDTPGESDDLLAALAAAWRPAALREPGAVVALRCVKDGRQRRVYGRPGRFVPDSGAILGVGVALATFRLADPLHYDDDEQAVTLRIVPPSTGGLLAPLVAPLSTARSSAPDARFITVRGDAPAPVRVTFRGPVTDPWVRGTGWEVGLKGSIAYDGEVTVDTRTTTVLRSDGASVAGMLTRRTRLAEVRLAPGLHELTFGGIDPTGTATATVAWRGAYLSL